MHSHGVLWLVDMIPIGKYLFLNRFLEWRLHKFSGRCRIHFRLLSHTALLLSTEHKIVPGSYKISVRRLSSDYPTEVSRRSHGTSHVAPLDSLV